MAGDEEQNESEQQEVTDDQAADDAIKDAEPKTYTEDQFSGLLRDKQAETAARQQAQADAAAARTEAERLQGELEEARKPKDELDEEVAQEPVTRAELATFGKELVATIGKTVTQQRDTDKTTSLKNAQAQDAQALVKTHTVKSQGIGLDAMTVIDEGTPYLRIHFPELIIAAEKNPHYATKLYEYCAAHVPSIKKKVRIRENALHAAELDQSGDTPPLGGGTRPMGNEEAVLMSILDGSMSEAEVEKLTEE